MLDAILWVFQNIAMAFYNLAYAVSHPQLWLDWSDKQAIMRVVYYGGSIELFFVAFTTFLVLTGIGIWKTGFMWTLVRGFEGFANTVGRFAAWAGLIMVIQQIIIVFIQRIFARPDLVIGFGIPLQFDVSWYSEELKLYNALIVTLCATYTFVQGGHVRVDLIYSAVGHRAKRVIDMFGSLIFMMPMAVLTWMYGWYFMWRHLIVPNPSASETLDRLLMKSRALRWNVETIGFSPNGFNGYFLFKILLVAFAGMVFLHAMAFFWRSYLEFREGPESADKYLDKDTLGAGEEAYEGTH
ncbi:TRAP transporter small permease subunit [Roseovarius sp.]|uniref:TRAP transporter small permease subunit n=1 Tax=Roseovarius sp. TaxID=1486281 RepID=UPI002608CB5B|nr:TRAP transporter small permease subunit [Roseovarius sp.]